MRIDARPALLEAPAPARQVELEAESEPESELESARESDAVVYEMLDTALPRGGIDLKDHMSAIEIGLIRKALEEADGTVAGAARLLRIRRTTLVEKLRKYRLSA